jgi:phosphoribosyl 1,2-cyclic phosphate phosphodiesterase
VVEQIALDFRTWRAYPQKQICLLLPEQLQERIMEIRSQYGPVIDFYRESGFVRLNVFQESTRIGDIAITAIPVDRGSQTAFVYVFEQSGRRVVYAPCDIKPFPGERAEVRNADVLVIQPGIFEDGLKHGFKYPSDHISRTTLYTFEQTMALAEEINARKTVLVHLEEYWNRSHDDYCRLAAQYPGICFTYDGMQFQV